ncbi:WGR domain-containing protein [Waterburya agarophytonicola K14]|uniref:NAD(+) ADP-ribosyltransferase n=1 Tax=Waterburya agarophytonicola KI4 TaxID=2874699 RepID=A0A964FH91_9CYAN|nr:WGR domain-containing protein [Waterburya agarophytonicola]MCC0179770.1 WGR domain-containing protein [Waterburya agarophytonicola KI4]
MSTITASRVLDTCTLIYVEVGENSNKVWRGSLFNDGSFLAEWGRVGNTLQCKHHCLGSIALAQSKFERTKRQKIRKGYTQAQLVEGETKQTDTIKPEELEEIASKQIKHGRDPRSKELIRYLVKSNIHAFTSQTDITYNPATGGFKTPLGIVTTKAIAEAREYLIQIAATRKSNSYKLRQLLSKYLRLIPQNLGHKLDESQFASLQEIQRQYEILNALDAAIAIDRDRQQVFECAIERVPGSTVEGKKTFRQINQLYKSTSNQNHLAAKYKLRRLYKLDIPSMREAFTAQERTIGNVKQHWHGTKASNLLSILRQGLIIPPASAVQCTGRMFGNGIYGSQQSTKALNYATNYWNASGEDEDRVFMLLCDFAMGKEYCPQSYSRNFPVTGYDSTYVAPGAASIINQESIVYRTEQVNIKYLCEFS